MKKTPFNIGYDLYRSGGGLSDTLTAVEHDSDLEECLRGYNTALADARDIPTLTEVVMEENSNEVMDILQEECAEVVQAVSKIRRFGIDNAKPGTVITNREHLEEEIGDLLAMIDILQINNIVNWGHLHRAKRAKIEKLKKWSNIPNLENI